MDKRVAHELLKQYGAGAFVFAGVKEAAGIREPITKTERAERKKKRKQAAKSRKRNRN